MEINVALLSSYILLLSWLAIVAVEWGNGGGRRKSGGRVSVCLLPSSSDLAPGLGCILAYVPEVVPGGGVPVVALPNILALLATFYGGFDVSRSDYVGAWTCVVASSSAFPP